MTDEELCKALRSALWGQGHHINIKAADRIKQLAATCEQLERERDELDVLALKYIDLIRQSEAKLAKAVEALRHTLDKSRDADQSYAELCFEVMWEIRTTLAELEGKNE